MEVNISKEAAHELAEAAAWYEQEELGLGTRLIDAFEHAIQLLGEPNPPLTPLTGSAADKGAKKLLLHKFPFSVIAIQRQETMIVVALAHHARKPGYWRKRAFG